MIDASTDSRFFDNLYFSPSGCWLWTGARNADGYGLLRSSVEDRMVGAHRISWEVMEGPIPAGLFVCHDCDVRSCVNPDHLFLGTAADNAEDMAQKGRGTSKLDRTEREQVVQLRDQGLSMRAIAQAFGCSPTHICNVLGRRGQGAPRLQSSQRESIRLRHGAGETQAALAAEFGVTPSAVSRIVKQEAI